MVTLDVVTVVTATFVRPDGVHAVRISPTVSLCDDVISVGRLVRKDDVIECRHRTLVDVCKIIRSALFFMRDAQRTDERHALLLVSSSPYVTMLLLDKMANVAASQTIKNGEVRVRFKVQINCLSWLVKCVGQLRQGLKSESMIHNNGDYQNE